MEWLSGTRPDGPEWRRSLKKDQAPPDRFHGSHAAEGKDGLPGFSSPPQIRQRIHACLGSRVGNHAVSRLAI